MMAGLRTIARRVGTKRKIAATGLALSIGAMLLATELPGSLSLAGGGSAALAELLARSPGARVGGVALKAKDRRSKLAAAPSGLAGPTEAGPGKGAEVMAGAVPGPESAVPAFVAPGGSPPDVFAPAIPASFANSAAGGVGGGPGFAGVPGPVLGGGAVFGPGSSGGTGGGSGGGGIVSPSPGSTPPPTPLPTATGPGVVSPIPEPATWLLLIAGFGAVGSAMRRRRHVAVG